MTTKIIVLAFVLMANAPERVACAGEESQLAYAPVCASFDRASCEIDRASREEENNDQGNDEASLLQVSLLQVSIDAHSQGNASNVADVDFLQTHHAQRSSTSTCGLDGAPVVDCDKADMGSCGNACCTLDVTLGESPEALYQKVVTFLETEPFYTHVPGKMPFGEHAPDNVTTAGSFWKYIFQGTHTTSGSRHYNDTLDFNIRSSNSASSTLRAFSISDIHGALGDSGQNYKTLAYMLRALGVSPSEATILWGCGHNALPPKPGLIHIAKEAIWDLIFR